MKILVLQHIAIEDPGTLKDLMLADNFELVTIELDQGEKIPENLDDFDGMLCMGGPMDTWMEAEYPWLVQEKEKIKHYVKTLEKPFIGFCLGAQLLGEVVGGQVVQSNPSEIGVLDVNLSNDRKNDLLFEKFPEVIKSVQWHSYEVCGLDNTPEVTVLGHSPVTRYQIFRYKKHAYGIQFHIEVRPTTVQDWGDIAEYKQALENTLGANALNEFDTQAKQHMSAMNHHAALLYNGFKQLLANTSKS
ncbi:MAG: type 1 glutamine amidotransferase [Proteobacteria bacterium]|nr:type 1 glutamine amidotransferase [Pseudomonadota bacterium]